MLSERQEDSHSVQIIGCAAQALSLIQSEFAELPETQSKITAQHTFCQTSISCSQSCPIQNNNTAQ